MVKSRKRSKKRAISEIKKYQTGKHAVSTLIPKSCFDRVARRMGSRYKFGLRFRDDAMEGLQHATESYIVELLAKANRICIAGKRETLSANDIRLALSIAENTNFEQKQQPVFQTVVSDTIESEEEQNEDAGDAEDAEDAGSEGSEEEEGEEDTEDTEDRELYN